MRDAKGIVAANKGKQHPPTHAAAPAPACRRERLRRAPVATWGGGAGSDSFCEGAGCI